MILETFRGRSTQPRPQALGPQTLGTRLTSTLTNIMQMSRFVFTINQPAIPCITKGYCTKCFKVHVKMSIQHKKIMARAVAWLLQKTCSQKSTLSSLFIQEITLIM